MDAEKGGMNADRIYQEVTSAGEKWADCKAAYEALDDMTKTVYADIMTNYMPPICSTKGEAECRAYADKDYKAHLVEKGKARRAWLLAQVGYDGLKMLAELRRSQESTRRAELTLR